MTHPQPPDPSDALAQAGPNDPRQADLHEVLKRVVELAKLTLPDVAEASVTVLQGASAYTPAYTGDLASALDELQYQFGHGPCLLAASAVTIESVSDMTTETRWPDWTAGALQAGARSSLSIALPINQTVSAALNLYAITANAFDDSDIAVAQSLAGYASLATAKSHVDNAKTTLSRHIDAVMDSEVIIEQAKGITMVDRQCTAQEALDILTATAKDTGRTVRDVAQAVVDRTAETPGQ
jgi:GAF domain-containing protein